MFVKCTFFVISHPQHQAGWLSDVRALGLSGSWHLLHNSKAQALKTPRVQCSSTLLCRTKDLSSPASVRAEGLNVKFSLMGLGDHLPFINISMDPGMEIPAEVPHLRLATISQSLRMLH